MPGANDPGASYHVVKPELKVTFLSQLTDENTTVLLQVVPTAPITHCSCHNEYTAIASTAAATNTAATATV
jgi:hypothetical protein